MKRLILTLAIGTFISAFATSCNECGFCNAPFIDLDAKNVPKVCKSGNETAYKTAVAECEARGGWYWAVTND